jgi:colicin import membrane protein
MESTDTVLDRPAVKPRSPKTKVAGAAAEVAKPQNASLVIVESTLTEYDRVEAGLLDLEKKYKDTVYVVDSAQGMTEAKAARVELREIRYGITKAATAAKAPLNALKKDIDARGDSIVARLVDIETPIHEQIKAEEDRAAAAKEAEKAAKAAAAARAQTAIDDIRGIAVEAVTSNAEAVDLMRTGLNNMELTLELFGERTGEALQAKNHVLETLDTLHAAAVVREAAEARAAADRAELEQMRAAQAERERKAEEERVAAAKEADERRAEENRQAEQRLADQRAEFERQQAAAREEQRIERERIDAERAELDRQRKEEQDRAEAARAEKEEAQRAEQRRLDEEEAARRRAAEEAAEATRAEAARVERERAAAEQQRLDDEAKARREEEERAHAADQLRRNASATMLEALQCVLSDEAFVDLHAVVQALVTAAVVEATGAAA